MASLGKLTVALRLSTEQIDRASAKVAAQAKKTGDSWNRAQRSLESFGKAAKATGRLMSTYLTLPILGVGTAAVKMAMDFEASMAKVIGLVGVSEKLVNKWSESVKRMAPEVGRSPRELADALYFITSAGIRTSEAMEVLEMSAKASAAGMGETKLIADLVTSAMNAFGKEHLSAAMAVDILTETVREGKSEATLLATTMGMVLPIAAELGATFNQVGAGMAAMTRTGTTSATAAMQLRQIFNSLLKPAKQAEDALYAMGTSSAELRKTIREDGLLDALTKIRMLTNTYGEEIMASVFPNIRALSGVLDIMGKNLANNIKIFENLNNATGRLGKAFGAAESTMKFKFAQALQNINRGMTELGMSMKSYLVPAFEGFGNAVSSLTDKYLALDKGSQKFIFTLSATVLAVGPLITVIGFFTANVIPLFMVGIAGMVRALGGLLIMLGSLNPWMLAGIAAGIVAAKFAWVGTEATRTAIKQERLNAQFKKMNLQEGIDQLTRYKQVLREVGLLIPVEKQTIFAKDPLAPMVDDGFFKKFAYGFKKNWNTMLASMGTGLLLPFKDKGFRIDIMEGIDRNAMDKVNALLEAAPTEYLKTLQMNTDAFIKDLETKLQAYEGLKEIKTIEEIKILYSEEEMKELEVGAKYIEHLKTVREKIGMELERIDKLSAEYAKDWEGQEIGGPALMDISRATRDYQNNMELMKVSTELGVKGFSALEAEFKAVESALNSFITGGAAKTMKDGKVFDLKAWQLSISKGDIGKSLQEWVARYNELLTTLEKTKSIKAAKDAIEDLKMELAFLEAKKLIFPDFDLYTAKVGVVQNLTDALIKLKVESQLLGKPMDPADIIDLDKFVMLQMDLLHGSGLISHTMENLSKEMQRIDAEVNLSEDWSGANEDKIQALGEAIAILSNEVSSNLPLVGQLTQEYIAYGGTLEALEALMNNLKVQSKSVKDITDEMNTSINNLTTFEGLFDFDLDSLQGYKQLEKYLRSVGIEFDHVEERSRIFTKALGLMRDNIDMPGMKDAIAELLATMDNAGIGINTFKEKFLDAFDAILSATSSFVSAMGSLIEAQKQRELSAVGQSAKKREAIEKAYHEKQQRWAIANVLISMAMGIAKVWGTAGIAVPVAIAVSAIHVASALAQIATISAQSFEDGGIVYGETLARVGEYAGASSNPEVIAPLDKLVSILRAEFMGGVVPDPRYQYAPPGMKIPMSSGLGGTKGDRKVEFKIHRDELIAILDNAEMEYKYM